MIGLSLLVAVLADPAALYELELATGEVRLVTLQPAAGHTHVGSPSYDVAGGRLLFDSWNETEGGLPNTYVWSRTEDDGGREAVRRLRHGNVPVWLPVGDDEATATTQRVVMQRMPEVAGEQMAVLDLKQPDVMQKAVGDGHFPVAVTPSLVLTFESIERPDQVTLVDLEDESWEEVIRDGGLRLYSRPAVWPWKPTDSRLQEDIARLVAVVGTEDDADVQEIASLRLLRNGAGGIELRRARTLLSGTEWSTRYRLPAVGGGELFIVGHDDRRGRPDRILRLPLEGDEQREKATVVMTLPDGVSVLGMAVTPGATHLTISTDAFYVTPADGSLIDVDMLVQPAGTAAPWNAAEDEAR